MFAVAFSTFLRYFSKAFTAFVSGCSHIVCLTHVRLFLIGLFNCSYFDLSYSPSVRNIYLPRVSLTIREVFDWAQTALKVL